MCEEETMTWSVDLEVSLFKAMRRHKPVGVTKHFQMMVIQHKLNDDVGNKKMISVPQIWKHLGKLYALSALDDSEIIPFPNKATDFSLPSELTNPQDAASDTPTEGTKPQKPQDKMIEKIKEESKDSPSSSSSSTPKRDGRKRTRGNVQNLSDTPPSTKRARRT